MILKNATVFNGDFEKVSADVAIEGERISKIGDLSGEDELDLTDMTVMPGLIDIHVMVRMLNQSGTYTSDTQFRDQLFEQRGFPRAAPCRNGE